MRLLVRLLPLVLLWSSSACADVSARPTKVQRSAKREQTRPALPTKPEPRALPRKAPKPKQDPYAGWSSWCEPEVLELCNADRDCEDVPHPSNKSLKCIRPWYADASSDYRVCSPGFSNRTEREHQRARIRELVRLQYSGESEACENDKGWRCGHSRRRGDRLAGLLRLVAQRETTMRTWKRHRLNGDVKANRNSFDDTAEVYAGNRHRRQRWRWEYGLGLYGANASFFVDEWSTQAPPEILCREVEATEAYLRAARRSWRKLKGGIDCDGDGVREWHGFGGSPTWYDIHHATSGGQLCPGNGRGKFEARAKRAGLDPYAPVSLAELGEPIPSEGQTRTALVLKAQIDVFSTVWQLRRLVASG